MRTAGRMRVAASRASPAVRGLALIFTLCVAVRVISSLGADTASTKLFSGLASDAHVVAGILDFELGRPAADDGGGLAGRLLGAALPEPGVRTEISLLTPLPPEVSQPPDSATPPPEPSEVGLFYTFIPEPEAASPSPAPNVVTKPVTAADAGAIQVNNRTNYAVDALALLNEPVDISLSADSRPVVLIIHTHGSEAYMPDGEDTYVESDPYRTGDKNVNIIRVGDELGSELAKRGIAFLHDRRIYDYPSYQGAYTRSLASIESYLKENPSIRLVIDIHRDAIEGRDGTIYKTVAQIGEETCAQVLLVMGTDFSGLKHPGWRENLKVALRIQHEMNTLYPSLAKPMELSQYRYNQHATSGSMLVEIGCTGNTLQESLAAARYFADAASNVIQSLYENG